MLEGLIVFIIKLAVIAVVAYGINRWAEHQIIRLVGLGVCVLFALIVLAQYLGINL